MLVCFLVLTLFAAGNTGMTAYAGSPFVGRSGIYFTLNGRPFYFGGANISYLPWATKTETDNALRAAVALHLRVIRTFASLVIGSPDGQPTPTIWSFPGRGPTTNLNVHGVYYQYWNSATDAEGFNDGPNGLQRLDYVVKRASQLHLKLLISLVDNWQYTGGMDQYLAWYGLKDHNAFFTNLRVRQDYKNWIAHLLNHVNVFTGVRYRDDPTIFAWELANEPEPKTLSNNVLLPWIKVISAYIKSLDSHHLVAVGSVGRDLAAETSIPTIDFGTEHLYPEHQKLTVAQSVQLLQNSISTVHRASKPMVLEEFGYSSANRDQASVYQTWTKTMYWRAGAGFLFWRLAGLAEGGHFPPDNGEGFDVHPDGTATAKVLSQAAQWMGSKR